MDTPEQEEDIPEQEGDTPEQEQDMVAVLEVYILLVGVGSQLLEAGLVAVLVADNPGAEQVVAVQYHWGKDNHWTAVVQEVPHCPSDTTAQGLDYSQLPQQVVVDRDRGVDDGGVHDDDDVEHEWCQP